MDHENRTGNEGTPCVTVCHSDLPGGGYTLCVNGEPVADFSPEGLTVVLEALKEGLSPGSAVLRGRRIW